MLFLYRKNSIYIFRDKIYSNDDRLINKLLSIESH